MRNPRQLPPKESLDKMLSYDPETGLFLWRCSPSKRIKAGTPAGSLAKFDYWQIGLGGKNYPAHRVAWLMHYGKHPEGMIDHINRQPLDNRICNLRLATNQLNQQNTAIKASNTSGFPGVTWHKSKRRWRALIRDGAKQVHLGHFKDPAEAHQAYLSAKERLHSFRPSS